MAYGSPTSNRIQIYFLTYFSYPKSSTCSANLNLGVFEKLILENTFWPNYFCKKILYCTIHMVWSSGRSFGSRKGSIEGKLCWLLRALENTERKPTQIKRQILQKFLSNHTLSWYIILSVVPWKSGCDSRQR